VDGVLAGLIRKYAILLSVFLVVEKLLSTASTFMVRVLEMRIDWGSYETSWLYTICSLGPFYVINIIVAVIVYQDMRKTNTVMRAPVIFLTLFFHAIGVCLFFLLVVLKELMSRIEKTRGQASGWEPGQ
jgi:hypothetical protein